MKNLKWFLLVVLAGIVLYATQMDWDGFGEKVKVNNAVFECLPDAKLASSPNSVVEISENRMNYNFTNNEIGFTVSRERTTVTEHDGSFESIAFESDYLYNLFQEHSSAIFELANNYGIGLYNNEKEFIANINTDNPMIYYDLRSDTCYLYCFVNDKEGIHILFDFFGGVMVICEGYLPNTVNSICNSRILLNIFDMGSINQDNLLQSKEFYSEWVEFVNGLDIGLYREKVSNIY